MTNDPVNYVRQGALIASALIMIQQTEITCPKVTCHTLHTGLLGGKMVSVAKSLVLGTARKHWQVSVRALWRARAECTAGSSCMDQSTRFWIGERCMLIETSLITWQHFNSGHYKNKCSFLKSLKASCNDIKVTVFTNMHWGLYAHDLCEHRYLVKKLVLMIVNLSFSACREVLL